MASRKTPDIALQHPCPDALFPANLQYFGSLTGVRNSAPMVGPARFLMSCAIALLAPAWCLAQADYAGVDAWVAIGIGGEFTAPPAFKAPVLDIYGEKDIPAVLHHVQQRAAVLKQLRGSGQVQVAGADHFFSGWESELVRQVKLFLDSRLK